MTPLYPEALRSNRSRIVACVILASSASFLAGRYTVSVNMESRRRPNATAAPSAFAPPKGSTPAVDALTWSKARWAEAQALPGGAVRSASLAHMLESLAEADPSGAMTLAIAEHNRVLRWELEKAVLRGWARVDVSAAAAWARQLPNQSDRSTAMAEVFSSAAAAQPANAIAVAGQILSEDPAGASGYGASLIDGLCQNGNFALAVQVAGAIGGQRHGTWLSEAYTQWATYQPEAAAAAAQTIADPTDRGLALHGVAGGWADADPGGLAQYAAQLPPGADRSSIVGQALQSWAKADPAAASAWINSSSLGADLDQGVATVASEDYLAPDVAAGWAASITDPQLRSSTLTGALRNWMHSDVQAAQQYLESTNDLLPADRQKLTQLLTVLQPK